jgi:O-antigen ligase
MSSIKNSLLLPSLFLPIVGSVIVFLVGTTLGIVGTTAYAMSIGVTILAFILILRQDEVTVMVIMAIHLYVDWYLVYHLVAIVLAIILMVFLYLSRSSERPWVPPLALRLWLVFLILALFPAANGALTFHDELLYYPSIVFGALIMFWLGALLARSKGSLRRLFQAMALLGVCIAIHTIIQTTTGVTLFASPRADAYLLTTSNYNLAFGLDVTRSGSFFNEPNWNGAFLAMIFFIPLGLFVASSSFLPKLFYLVEAIVILPALLFTYSTGAWTALLVGMIVFIIFAGCMRDRLQLIAGISIAVLVIVIFFNTQITLQLQHSSNVEDLASRLGAWQTAWRVIQEYPLTGIGMGHEAYLLRSAPFRTPAEYIPLDHPHNSYLEWAAMAGLPVLLVFLALVGYALWQAIHNWIKADIQTRSLLSGGLALVFVLSVSSWSNDCWTLPPLSAIGWLILGAISSPILMQSFLHIPSLGTRLIAPKGVGWPGTGCNELVGTACGPYNHPQGS